MIGEGLKFILLKQNIELCYNSETVIEFNVSVFVVKQFLSFRYFSNLLYLLR